MTRRRLRCARAKCRKRFRPERATQVFCSKRCRDAAAQERLRERAKAATALAARIPTDELGLPVETEVDG